METLAISILCLALNVWHEARSEPTKAQMAVALVTVNRSRAKGRTICEEVYSPHQFSWTTEADKRVQLPLSTSPEWIEAQEVAKLSLTVKDFTKGALWYHHVGVSPWWKWRMKEVGTWGAHVFYVCKPKYTCNWR